MTWGDLNTTPGVPTVINVKDPAYGALGNARLVADANITAATAALTSTSAAFTTADIGKKVAIYGAGAAAAWGGFVSTISTLTDSSHVVLAASVTNTVGSAIAAIGVDDSTAIQAALNAANTAGGGTVYLPAGIYLCGTGLTVYSNCALVGAGRENTSIIGINSANFNTPVINVGAGTITDQMVEVRNLKVAMVGPNARNTAGHGVYVTSQRFLLDNVEVSLPQKIGQLDNGSGAGIAAAAISARWTVASGSGVATIPPAVGEQIIIDAGGTGATASTLNQFSEIRAVTSVTSLGGGQYTIGWAGGLLWGHQLNCRGESLAFSVPCVGIAVNGATTTQSAGPGLIHGCVARATIADGFFLANCNRIGVSDSEIYASGDDGISLHSGNSAGFGEIDAVIVNNRIEHAGSGGITVRGGQRYVIANNDIKMTYGQSVAVIGINSGGNSWYASDAIHIINNLCFGGCADPQPSYGLGAGTSLPTVLAVGGIVLSVSNGIQLSAIKIAQNRIRFFKGPAILAYATDAVANSTFAGLTIENNNIQSYNSVALGTGQTAAVTQLGSGQTAAIFVEKDANSLQSTQITNNSIGVVAQEGIWVASNMTGQIVMSGNLMTRLNQNNAGSITAIKCNSTGVSTVIGNTLIDDQARITTALDITGSGAGSIVGVNSLAGKGIAGGLPTLTSVNAGLSASSVAAGSTSQRGTINITVGAGNLAAGTNLFTLNWVPAFKDATYALALTDSSGHAVNFVYSTKAAGTVIVFNADQINLTVAYTIDYVVVV